MRRKQAAFTVSTFFLSMAMLASCAAPRVATLPSEDAQYELITVKTPGQSGAHCFLQAGAHSYTVSTPGQARVHKSPEPIEVTCFKGEHLIGNKKVLASVAPVEQSLGEDDVCISCTYPPQINIALVINPVSLERKVRQGP